MSSNRSRLAHREKGTRHWRWQRLSALLLIPLSLWLVVSFSGVVYSEYNQSLAWVHTPHVAILLVVTLVSLLFHGHLGVVVVIDDYVRGPWRKRATQISVLVTVLTALFAIVSIMMLFFIV